MLYVNAVTVTEIATRFILQTKNRKQNARFAIYLQPSTLIILYGIFTIGLDICLLFKILFLHLFWQLSYFFSIATIIWRIKFNA